MIDKDALVVVSTAPNRSNGKEVVGTTKSSRLPARIVFFSRADGYNMLPNEHWLVRVIKVSLTATGGFLVATPVRRVAGHHMDTRDADRVAADGDTGAPEQVPAETGGGLSVAEKAAFRVVSSRPPVTVRVASRTYAVREGYWYFFPAGHRHDRFAVCRWAAGADAPVIEADEIVGFEALFCRVHAVRQLGYMVWWPEKWERTGQAVMA